MAGAVAATVSGAPSTVVALATGVDPRQSVWAAATILRPRRPPPAGFGGLVLGGLAHLMVSAAWTAAFVAVARRWRMTATRGAIGGLLIAALDLGVIGRRLPAVAALRQGPQWADHVVFGAVLGRLLS